MLPASKALSVFINKKRRVLFSFFSEPPDGLEPPTG